MKMTKAAAFFLLASCCFLNAKAADFVKQEYQQGDFKLVYNKISAGICYDQNDYKVVEISASYLAEDIKNVTGVMPAVCTDLGQIKGIAVIAGTIGHNNLIDKLIKEGKINTAGIAGRWETYGLAIVEKPFPNIDSALIIFGSDRRGTAYGIFELSKQIGVSPWYWWADVPVDKKENLIIKKGFYTEGPPSVRYRGIFLNDEDWGLKPWASKTFDPNLGDIGPRTYEKIFELLLRLKANHCWPAMHSCTKPFNYYPDNKKVADDYAIVMGSAHCEPLLFNNASEWDTAAMGEWRYDTNKENICKALDKRVSENGQFENLYTIGIRGIHDSGIIGNLSLEEKIVLMEKVFADERKILTAHIDKKITEIPQVFIPYKEVLTLYDNGLKVPEDVALIWVDDNFGYIRRLSNPLESKRPGGSGVYYHFSYLGNPHDYLWLFSTAPALMWEEMTKAYSFDSRRIWIVNVGDIKPAEYGTSFFLDLAWDVNMVDHSNISSHLSSWLGSVFGREYSDEMTAIMKEFYALGYERKPEFMGFGSEFGFHSNVARWEDTEYSFINYREAERRLERFAAISDKATQLYEKMPARLKPACFQLVYYPVVAGNYMNRKILLAQKNRWYAGQGRSGTNDIAEQARYCYDKIKDITKQYNELLDGKWKHMMAWEQTRISVYYNMPPLETIEVPQESKMGIFVQNFTPNRGIDYTYVLPCFNPISDSKYFIEIFNKGKTPFNWKAVPDQKWIKLSRSEGDVATEERIFVSIDWSAVPKQENLRGAIRIQGAGSEETVFVNCFNPASPAKEELKGTFVENDGVISIYAANYSRKVESNGISWATINGLGVTGKSVTMLPVTASPISPRSEQSPHLEYDIYIYNSGIVEIHSFVLPVFAINNFRGTFYGVSIDQEPCQGIDIGHAANSTQWAENVRRNVSENITKHYIDKPGKHTLKLWMIDTGMVFDKIIIDLGGLKRSCIGPEQTRVQ
ncbi:MAG: glycosyl hydrolase 115 family protein [Phycisphaerae bacterium]|jgi:hypothetical protein